MKTLNFMVGTISYLPDNAPYTENRITYHQAQLRWLENLDLDFPYYRVESGWGSQAREACKTTLNLRAIATEQHPPGYNRNILLNELYLSDYDWLICLDDDRLLYNLYNGDAFFTELNTKPIIKLAEQGYLITCINPRVEMFKKDNYIWKYKEDYWYFAKEASFGNLQICFIPNLVKYGYTPIWFDAETACTIDEAPEDIKFQLDWLLNKHRMIKNRNLITKEGGAGKNSSIFKDEKYRAECNARHKQWENKYLQEQAKNNPAIQTKKGLSARRNPPFNTLIPRSQKYVFTNKETPKER